MANRSEALRSLWHQPRGYCVEGHPIKESTALGPLRDLSRVSLLPDQVEVLERQSLEIFTIMANAGAPFATCLSSVLLTGMDWGRAISNQRND